MKHSIVLLALAGTLLLASACAPAPSTSTAPPPENTTSAAATPAPETPAEKPALAFETPVEPYWLLGECEYKDGWLAVYEEAFPDEYNKQFSDDTMFYALRWQTFDAAGKKTGQGNSEWSNGTPIHDLPLTPLRYEDGMAFFDAQLPKREVQNALRRRFHLAIDDEALPRLGRNPNNKRYIIEDWYPVCTDEGGILEFSTRYNAKKQKDETVLLLTDTNHASQSLVLEDFDPGFFSELAKVRQPTDDNGEPNVSKIKATLNSANKTAALVIPKLSVTVDFAKGETTVERHYTADMLETELIKSPDGNYSIYMADSYQMHEAPGGGDYLAVSKDGKISFLYSGTALDQLAFVDNDRIVVSSLDALTFYDAATGEQSAEQPAFDFGEATIEGETRSPKYLVVGSAVDMENQRILAAYRLNNFGLYEMMVDGKELREFPLSLAVFDFSGKKLSDQELEASISPYTKFAVLTVNITLDQAGTATLSWDHPQPASVSVEYMK